MAFASDRSPLLILLMSALCTPAGVRQLAKSVELPVAPVMLLRHAHLSVPLARQTVFYRRRTVVVTRREFVMMLKCVQETVELALRMDTSLRARRVGKKMVSVTSQKNAVEQALRVHQMHSSRPQFYAERLRMFVTLKKPALGIARPALLTR